MFKFGTRTMDRLNRLRPAASPASAFSIMINSSDTYHRAIMVDARWKQLMMQVSFSHWHPEQEHILQLYRRLVLAKVGLVSGRSKHMHFNYPTQTLLDTDRSHWHWVLLLPSQVSIIAHWWRSQCGSVPQNARWRWGGTSILQITV